MEKKNNDENLTEDIKTQEEENTVDNVISEDVMEQKRAEKEANSENKLLDEIESLKDKLARSQAEFQNYRRRVETEKQELTVYANEKIMTELLTSIDNLERALDSSEDKESALYKGIEMTKLQLLSTLEKFGLSEIDNTTSFDPNFHHAVMQEEGENPGEIIDVFQKGYKLKDRVLRASMVKVSK